MATRTVWARAASISVVVSACIWGMGHDAAFAQTSKSATVIRKAPVPAAAKPVATPKRTTPVAAVGPAPSPSLKAIEVADTPWQARHNLTSAKYQSAFDELTKQGYRLTYISGYTSSGSERFAALFEKSSGPGWIARHGLTAAQYQAEFDKQAKAGYRLTLVNGYAVGNSDRYVAIWEKKSGPAMGARHGLTAAQYQAEFDAKSKAGYRLAHVSGYAVGGQARYAAIWVKDSGAAQVARHGLTSAQYQEQFNAQAQAGYRLAHVSGYEVGGKDYYAAIWEKQSGPVWFARHGLDSTNYQNTFDNGYYQGYRLREVNGYTKSGKPRFAAVWEKSKGLSSADAKLVDDAAAAYMSQQSIPGLALAVVKEGRLVFAKGYGLANKSTGEEASALSTFRVASVSKPITGVAIMKLIQDGKLSLSSKVFGSGALLGTTYGSDAYSADVKKITVQHLLEHTARMTVLEKDDDGKSVEADPMFRKLDYDHKKLIGWVLDDGKVMKTPGTQYKYSNFGYTVLGRIIEKVSGQSYENYVRNEVLAPAGISNMRVGNKEENKKLPREVTYYGGNPYNLLPQRMDAHGGWVASPVDLLRLVVRVDGFETKSDILNASTISTMFTKTTAKDENGNDPSYGKGWAIASSDRNHNGAMSGTIAVMVRRNDGYAFAIVANTRPSDDKFAGKMKAMGNSIVDGVKTWPSGDLF